MAEMRTSLISMEGVMNSMIGMFTSQSQGLARMHSFVPGATYYVEVPRIEYVEKVIKVPQFSVKGQWEKIGVFDCEMLAPKWRKVYFLTYRNGSSRRLQSCRL